MPDTFTANYNFTKPEVNASRDTWGTKWNTNVDNIDTLLKSLSDNKIQYNPSDKTSSADVNFIGPRPKAGGTTEAKVLQTREDVIALWNAIEPVGTIKLWWGAVNAIPTGWALCNGQGGTPNFLDRVPVCAGSGYALGAAGGATSVALAAGNLPPHYHGIYFNSGGGGNHNHGGNTSTDGSHNHSYTRTNTASNYGYPGTAYAGFNGQSTVNTGTDGSHNHSIVTTYSGDHVHLISGNTDNGPGLAGSAFDIRQPWIGVYFIMKMLPTA